MGAMRLHRYEIAPALCETAVSRSLRNVRKLVQLVPTMYPSFGSRVCSVRG